MPDDIIAEGRHLARVNLWRVFAANAGVAWVASPSSGTSAWLRLALIGFCCLLVYRGLRWALTLLGLLTFLAAVLSVVLAFAHPGMHWATRILFGGLGFASGLSYIILYQAPEIRVFMATQRERPEQFPPPSA